MTIRYLALFAPFLLGGCYGVAGHDEVDRYFQRSDSITMTAGDAKQVNAVTHTIHPWPRYVGDRRIAYDARRVGSAVTRYGNQQQPVDQLPDMGDPTKLMGQRPPVTQNVNVTGLGAGASAGVSVPVGGAAGR
ncbi:MULTISPECIES: hypothetical protein [unclassified Bradyrhizobium]|uniref:hypothetical protein n=1 Tax=unclassified Bradyrhizobium TaxID=2631580 RepID=UPI0008E9039A|nr:MULTISPECIES: hypothetical protein [unclassified Bradyrhizobium]MBB4262988.1 hypothetical protein [Bradyrhizobium sp. CIR3A]MBB4377205.1 hypothetical protein [Bradyrhizobium sp. SBR1B]MBB4398053.1 hypothetical protein [Bradyrhizobium sp. ERR14]MBB4423381.1 hypothetical protein [Bradyrhizobium sp. CIR48]NYG47244.1 hypothetical protein [Bradyrhizobium sp. IAR9]